MTPRTLVSRFVSALGLAVWLGTAFIACGPGYVFDEMPTGEKLQNATTGGSSTGGADCNTDTFANYGQAFAAKTCAGAGCHAAGTVSPDLTVQASFANSKADIVKQVTSKAMPLGGTLSDADRARFIAWMNCNAP